MKAAETEHLAEDGDFESDQSRQSLAQALNMPWRARLELKRLLALPYIRLLFKAHGITWGRGWQVFGMPIIQRYRGSRIIIGNEVDLRSWPTSNPLAPNHPVVLATRAGGAVIHIGNRCGLTGTMLVAADRIEIGDRVLLGANATIVDTDFHPLPPAERQRHPQAGTHQPVLIEDDVFVGMNSLILKGVTIGRGSVIGAGSVVTQSIPANVIAAGNPARVIRAL